MSARREVSFPRNVLTHSMFIFPTIWTAIMAHVGVPVCCFALGPNMDTMMRSCCQDSFIDLGTSKAVSAGFRSFVLLSLV